MYVYIYIYICMYIYIIYRNFSNLVRPLISADGLFFEN